MKTFILMWNPAISSVNCDDFNKDIPNADWCYFNWSIWDYEEAHSGDRVFLVRVGEGNTGIVLSGIIDGEPWEGNDWSGKGRQTFYVDIKIEAMVNSDKCPIITTDELMEQLPGFDWTGGHSGRLLPSELQVKLELMWLEYLNANQKIFDGKNASEFDFDFEDSANGILNEYLNSIHGNHCECCGYDYKKVWDGKCQQSIGWSIFWKKNGNNSGDILKDIHCICENCQLMGKKAILTKLEGISEKKGL